MVHLAGARSERSTAKVPVAVGPRTDDDGTLPSGQARTSPEEKEPRRNGKKAVTPGPDAEIRPYDQGIGTVATVFRIWEAIW